MMRAFGRLSPRSRVLLGATLVLALAAGGAIAFLASRGQGPAGVAPRVVALTTSSGAAVSEGDLIPAATPLRLTFNTTMDEPSVRLLANGAPIPLSWKGDGTSAALDVEPLHVGPVALAVASGARDASGSALPGWKLAFRLVFGISAHTVPLAAPALVQVPNDPAARDQVGLQSAAIVYEYLTEGGITRFTAIYTSAPDTIGPIRSGRLISFELTRRYGGLLLASGLSAGSSAVLSANPVPHIFDTGGGVFYRTGDRSPPNNLFTSGAQVQRAVAAASLSRAVLPAGSVPMQSGEPAASVTVAQHGSVYLFDQTTRTYTKQVGGRALADAATGQALHIQFLVVMHTTATPTNFTEDVNGQPGLDFDMHSGGQAEFFFDGARLDGHWSSPSPKSPLRFQLEGGAMISPPPLTWIDVVTS